MRRWEELDVYDKNTNALKTEFCLEPNVYDEILIDENTPKEIPEFNFLLTNTDPLIPIIKIEYKTENSENKILLSPMNDMKFNISPRT